MSLTLLKVELLNIRSHKKISITPSQNGVTAILGPNGAGKSTIIDSIAWCLYGEKPPGVSRTASIIREGVDLKKERSSVRVELKLERDQLLIERRIVANNGATECDVWEKGHDEDSVYKHVAGSAVSHVEPYLRKKLKMDKSGFLAAVLVQQKQVDQLISASPRERAEVIEKLTGISSITAGLVEARQEYNSLKKILQHSSFDENELSKLKKEGVEFRELLKKKKAELEKSEKELKSLIKLSSELGEKISSGEKHAEEITELRDKKVRLEAGVETREEELESLKKQKNEVKNKLTSLTSSMSFATIEGKLKESQNALAKVQKKSYKIDHQIAEIKDNLKKSEEIIEKSSVKDIGESDAGLKKYRSLSHALQKKITDLQNEESSFRADVKKLRRAIDVIASSDGTCPTCLQHVEDPADAIKSLESEKAAVETKIKEFKLSHNEYDEKLLTAEKGVDQFTILSESIREFDELREKLNVISKKKAPVDGEIHSLEGEITGLEKMFNSAQRHQDMKVNYDQLLAKAVSVSDAIEKLKIKLKDVNERNQELGKVRDITTLRRKFNETSEKKSNAQLKSSKISGEISVFDAKISFIDEKVQKNEKEQERYNTLLKSVEVAGASTELIEEFREERIRMSLPVVGTYASDLLSRFTDGAFTQLKLDEKFNATVVLANGNERAVGLLSGGELSAAAISLRLAVSMLLNSGNENNTLILDEVLVSQDESRVTQILSTIKDVCKGQVLMVSHGPNTSEIADKVIEL